jgi:hypothetical protein
MSMEDVILLLQVANGDKVKLIYLKFKKKLAICYNLPFALARAPNDNFFRISKGFSNSRKQTIVLENIG